MAKVVITNDGEFDNQIDYNYASNDAQRSYPTTVSADRTAGDTILQITDLTGYPSKFYATSFSTDDNGRPERIRHMKVRVNQDQRSVTIESFEYNELDQGHKAGDIFLIKPSEEQHDQLIECVKYLRNRKVNADYADNAGHASSADNAGHATNADNAGHASSADNAGHATNADNANNIPNSDVSIRIDLGNGNLNDRGSSHVDGNGYIHIGGSGNEDFRGKFGGSVNAGVQGILPVSGGGTGQNDRLFVMQGFNFTGSGKNLGANAEFSFEIGNIIDDGLWNTGYRAVGLMDAHLTTSSGADIRQLEQYHTLVNQGSWGSITSQHVHCYGYRSAGAVNNVRFKCVLLLVRQNMPGVLVTSHSASS